MKATHWIGMGIALAAAAAQAQTLYKLIDKNGKVTYSEEAPKNFDGKVIRLDIDPNANRATLPKYDKGAEPAPKRAQAARGAKQAAPDVDEMRKRVDERKAALENAQNNPSDDDVQWIGNAGGGTRRVPTPDYQRRLAELERSLKEAEHELEQAEKGGH